MDGRWDVFVSYAVEDQGWAEWIADRLENAGLRVLIQAWDAVPGRVWAQLVQEGVGGGAYLVAVLSPRYLSSTAGVSEWQAVWSTDVDGAARRLIPVLVEPCGSEGLGLLGARTCIDLTAVRGPADERWAQARLISGVGAARSGRDRPAGPVSLPVRAAAVTIGTDVETGGWHDRTSTMQLETVPPLPSRFVGRADLVSETVARLVEGAASVVGLLGMGGAGKSTIARAAIDDPNLQARFPGGIVWVEIGPAPDMTACLARILATLGDLAPVVDLDNGGERLRATLASRPCLLVLDNLWNIDHLRAFPSGRSTRLLVTTRSRDALFTDSDVVMVGPAGPDICRAVLASYAGTTPESLPDGAAEEVLTRCGGLILPLAVAGGMIAEGYSWELVAQRLRGADLARLTARFADYPHADLLAALDASVQTLSAVDQRRYSELAVFEGRGHVPVAVVRVLWRATADLSFADTDDLIVRLVRRSLAQFDPAAGTIHLHDLMIEYARTAIGEVATAVLHGVLAEALLARRGGIAGLVPLEPARAEDSADRYMRTDLVRHLLASDSETTLARLLAAESTTASGRVANAWFTVHERAGNIADYLADVRAWWKWAAARTDTDPPDALAEASFAVEARCALIIGSVVSLAANVPPELFTRLVTEGLWSARQAIAHAAAMPEPADRVQALAAVVPLIPGEDLPTALAAIRAIDERAARKRALISVLPALPDRDREPVVDAALDVVLTGYNDEPIKTVIGLVPHLTPALLTKALDTMRRINALHLRAKGLAVLVPLCSPAEAEQVAREAVDAARATDDPFDRIDALGHMRRHFPVTCHDTVTSELLEAAHDAFRPGEKQWPRAAARALGSVPGESRRSVVAVALAAASTVEYESSRADALISLAPYLDPELAASAAAVAGRLTDDRQRLTVLAHLIPHLSEDARRSTVVRALRAVHDIDDRYHAKTTLLTELAPHLPDNFLPAAIDIARTVTDPAYRVEALATLAPRLTDRLRRRVLSDVLGMIRSHSAFPLDSYHAERVLVAIIPHLPADLCPEALTHVRRMSHKRTTALRLLAPRLPPELVSTVVMLAENLDEPDDRAEVLSHLAASPDLPDRRAHVIRAFAAARDASPTRRSECLTWLAPHLPPDLMPAALSMIRTIYAADPEAREWVDPARQAAIAAIAQVLPRGQLLSLLDVARTVDSPSDRAELMTELAHALPPHSRASALHSALEAARTAEDPETRTHLLADLLPLLPDDLRDGVSAEAVAAATRAETLLSSEAPDGRHAILWNRLLPYLNGRDRATAIAHALDAARGESNLWLRAAHLADLARCLPDHEADPVRQEAVQAALNPTNTDLRRRPKMRGKTADLARRLPAKLLLAFLNPRGPIDYHADEADRLSAVAPRLPIELLDLALEAARATDIKYGDRAQTLTSLVTRQSGPSGQRVCQEALDAAHAIDEPPSRVKALVHLLPHLPADTRQASLRQALDAARRIVEPDRKAQAILTVLPHLPTDTLPALLPEALDVTHASGRVELLAALVPYLPEPLRSKTRAQALARAHSVNFSSSRTSIAYDIANIAASQQPLNYRDLRAAIDLASGVGRAAVTRTLITALTEPAIVEDIFVAFVETQRWWK